MRLGIATAVSLAVILAHNADREVSALGVATFLLVMPLPYVYYFVAMLPALLVLLAVELERDGYPTISVVVLFSLQIHGYGLAVRRETAGPAGWISRLGLPAAPAGTLGSTPGCSTSSYDSDSSISFRIRTSGNAFSTGNASPSR